LEQAEKAYAQLLSNEQEMRLLRDAPASVHTRAEDRHRVRARPERRRIIWR